MRPEDLHRIDVHHLNDDDIAAAGDAFARDGIIRVSGLEDVATWFHPLIAGALESDLAQLKAHIDPAVSDRILSEHLRRRVSRIDTSDELRVALIERLGKVLLHLIGPFAQLSNNFHTQFKGGFFDRIGHGGYATGYDHMEVHGPYKLHQDFTGSSIATSPSGVTLWVPINTTDSWNVRLYPGSHRRGLICREFIDHDEPRLAALGSPVDVPCRLGEGFMFNALILHGTSNPGPERRVSCDIRFFPLCGFLPARVHFLADDPFRALARAREEPRSEFLRSPLLEDSFFLGEEVREQDVTDRSILNWMNFLVHKQAGEDARALTDIDRFVDREHGHAQPKDFLENLTRTPIDWERLEDVARQARPSPGSR